MNETIYTLIGKIIYHIQSIEQNICLSIKYQKYLSLYSKYKNVNQMLFSEVDKEISSLLKNMSLMSFGALIKKLEQYDILSNDDIDYLISLLSKRNHLVHQFFKENELDKTTLDMKVTYLNNFYNDSVSFDKYLSSIVKELKIELEQYK